MSSDDHVKNTSSLGRTQTVDKTTQTNKRKGNFIYKLFLANKKPNENQTEMKR